MIGTMSIAIPMLLLSLCLLLLLFLRMHKPKPKPINLPPGPRPLPVIGNLHQLSRPLHRSLRDLSKTYGPILHLKLGRVPLLVVSSPSLAELVLKTHDHNFCSRPQLVSSQAYSYRGSDVALSPHGDSWRNLKKVLATELVGPKKLPSQTSVREDETERMIRAIKARACSAVNLTEYVLRLIVGILLRVAFGREAEGGYGERSWYHERIDEIPEIVGSFFVGDMFPAFGWIDELTGITGKLKKSAREMDAFYREVIEDHMNGEKNRGKEGDFVDTLISMWRKEQISMYNIKGAFLNIFVAGTETSAATITWAMAELARNPSSMRKAQDELRSLLGNKERVEESDLPRLHYLKMAVNETLRLHPPAALLLPRESIQSCQIQGYDIGPKTRVLVNVWAIGRDGDAWENPEEFNPERFADGSVDYKGQCFQFLPFGGGRRICPGITMGVLMVELALANLLHAFKWELPAGVNKEDIDMSEALGVGSHKRTDLYLVAVSPNKGDSLVL